MQEHVSKSVSFSRLALWLAFASVLLAAVPMSVSQPRVVINEVMYHPPDDLDAVQFIELLNAGEAEVDVSGWSFNKGIKFTFPAGTKLGAGGFLVVCRNRAEFAERYGEGITTLGDW